MYNIGVVYANKDAYDEALVWYRKALDIWERLVGAEHPETARAMNNIGTTYAHKGEYHEALAWYRKALAVYGQQLALGLAGSANHKPGDDIVRVLHGARAPPRPHPPGQVLLFPA